MFVDIKNPRWLNSTHNAILLDVLRENTTEFGIFIAFKEEYSEHGRELYTSAINGLYGPILDSEGERILRNEIPVPEGYIVKDSKVISIILLETEATSEFERRLAPFLTEESKARAEIDEEYAAERKAKIATLLAVKKQSGWPIEVKWPQE